MKGFRIVAIKTSEKPKRIFEVQSTGAKLDYFKNLKENTIYPFTSDFTFPNDNFDQVIPNDKSTLKLYDFKSKGELISINVNAIVGNNGSGKSSLIELLFWANYNIGCVSKLLRNERNTILEPYKFIDLEILFAFNDNTLIKIIFKDGQVLKNYLFLNKGIFFPSENYFQVEDTSDLFDYFYSIVINYSHYALNSLEVGDWIISLFHKNDGYQTPIVLNPMRTKGIIDINREKRLLMRRLQGNILEEIGEQKVEDSLRNIGNNKIVTALKIKYGSRSFEKSNKAGLRDKVITAIEKNFSFKISSKDLDNNLFVNISINYIIEKLIKISNIYRPYRKYKDDQSLKYLDSYIKRIRDSNNHIVFKVKGAILYLKYQRFIFGDNFILNNDDFLFDIDDLSKKITKIKEKESGYLINTFTMVPPSFFESEIILEDGSSFSSLSSGEKQKIHSTSSIAYHIINLNSVNDEKDKKDRYYNYPYLNIILDEIELYYHPDWQRNYVKDLLDTIRKIPHDGIKNIKGINITFLTHSPFILSDIPSSNVLKLKGGKPTPFKENEETFGANISDILANDFFLTKGFMGEFVKGKINSLIDYINDDINVEAEWNEKSAKEFIELIGEPLIRLELRELYFNKFYDSNQIDIDQINKEIDRLKRLKKKKTKDNDFN